MCVSTFFCFFGSRILHERVDGVTSSGANCIGTDMDALFIPAIVSRFFHTHRSNANSGVVVVVVGGLDCDHKSLPLIVICSFLTFGCWVGLSSYRCWWWCGCCFCCCPGQWTHSTIPYSPVRLIIKLSRADDRLGYTGLDTIETGNLFGR
jgi:hypothetical protein